MALVIISHEKSVSLSIPTGFYGSFLLWFMVTMWHNQRVGRVRGGKGRGEDWALSMWPSIRQTAIQPARHIRVCWRYAIGTLQGSEPRKEIERFLHTAREPQIVEWRTSMKAPEWELFASSNSFRLCVSMFLLLLLCMCVSSDMPFYCYVTSAIKAHTPYLIAL